MYNIIVCDYNDLDSKIVSAYLENLAQMYKIKVKITLSTSAKNIIEILEYAKNSNFDIAFLDVDLGDCKSSGISLAKEILKYFPDVVNIFVSKHEISAIEAFSVRAFDYIQKPIDSEKFKIVFKRAIRQANAVKCIRDNASLLITVNNLKKKIKQSNIIYIEKILSRSKIQLNKTETIYVYESIKSLINRLKISFAQINQSTIVNTEEIEIVKNGKVTMKSGEVFSIGRTYKKSLKEHIINML